MLKLSFPRNLLLMLIIHAPKAQNATNISQTQGFWDNSEQKTQVLYLSKFMCPFPESTTRSLFDLGGSLPARTSPVSSY